VRYGSLIIGNLFVLSPQEVRNFIVRLNLTNWTVSLVDKRPGQPAIWRKSRTHEFERNTYIAYGIESRVLRHRLRT